jgi:hypothetical protein
MLMRADARGSDRASKPVYGYKLSITDIGYREADMTDKQEAYLIRLGNRPGSGMSQETIKQIRAEVRKLLSSLDEMEDNLDAMTRRVTFLETYLEDGQYGD